jgi:hypothetical protein
MSCTAAVPVLKNEPLIHEDHIFTDKICTSIVMTMNATGAGETRGNTYEDVLIQ